MSRFLLAISSNPALLCYGKMYTKWSISAKGSLRFLFGQIRSRFFETLRGVQFFLECFVKNPWARREGSRLAQINTSNMTFNQHTPPPLKTMAPALKFSQDRESEENGGMLCRWKLAFRIAFTHIWVGAQIQFENTSCGSRFFHMKKESVFENIWIRVESVDGVWVLGTENVFVFLCCGTIRKRTENCIFLTGDVGWMSGNAGPLDCRLVRTVTSAKKQS